MPEVRSLSSSPAPESSSAALALVQALEAIPAILTEVQALRAEVRDLRLRDEDPWLNAPQISKRLGISPEAWRGWRVRHPELDALGVGHRKLRRWRLSEVKVWLASKPRLARAVRPEGEDAAAPVESAA